MNLNCKMPFSEAYLRYKVEFSRSDAREYQVSAKKLSAKLKKISQPD